MQTGKKKNFTLTSEQLKNKVWGCFYKIFWVKIEHNIRNYTYKIGNTRNHSLSWETETGTHAYIPVRNIAHEQSHLYKVEKPGREHTYTKKKQKKTGAAK
jgi:hypothetical protein